MAPRVPAKPSFGYTNKQYGGNGNKVKKRISDDLHDVSTNSVSYIGSGSYRVYNSILPEKCQHLTYFWT